MSIAQRLPLTRKQKGLTQQALADAIGIHVSQIKRYEAGKSQPSLDALKKIAKTLRVSTDSLIFDDDELEVDSELTKQFNAITNMSEDEQAIIKKLLEGMIMKSEVERWSSRVR